jgi:hypothetical protein
MDFIFLTNDLLSSQKEISKVYFPSNLIFIIFCNVVVSSLGVQRHYFIICCILNIIYFLWFSKLWKNYNRVKTTSLDDVDSQCNSFLLIFLVVF